MYIDLHEKRTERQCCNENISFCDKKKFVTKSDLHGRNNLIR